MEVLGGDSSNMAGVPIEVPDIVRNAYCCIEKDDKNKLLINVDHYYLV